MKWKMEELMRKYIKKALLIIVCAVMALVTGTYSVQAAAAGIIRPYIYGFGSADDGSEGVESLIKAGDLKHLTYTDSTGHEISYYAHIPKDDTGNPIENLPLVVYMHGYSDGGSNNNIVLRYHNAVLYKLIKEQDNPERQAVILVPQTPNATNPGGETDWFKDQWVGIKGADKWSQWNRTSWNMDETPRTENLNSVVELIKTVQSDTQSDVDRAYVTGISMGGYATWDLISRNDDQMFAAAAPICGVGDFSKIENAKNTPIRTFHGSLDSTISANSTRSMYKALRKYGNITYTEYPDENHASWNAAYSKTLDDNNNGVSNIDDLINWMFNQSRTGTLDGKIDKEPLRAILKEAKAVNRNTYDDEEWYAIQTEITNADRYLEDDTASLQEINACIEKMDALLKETTASKTSKYDINIPLSLITAGSDFPAQNNGVANALDYDINTIWHTNWNVDYANTDKHFITFELPEGTIVNSLRYLPRQDSGINGVVTEYEMYAGDTLDNLNKISEGSWSNDKTWKMARFPETTARFIRFKSKKALSDTNRFFASAAEVHLANTDFSAISSTSSIVSEMLNNNPDNTWVFAGGKSVAGGYEESIGIRNFVGQFDEYVRFATAGNQINRMQRYVINAGKTGRTINEIDEKFDSVVKELDPKALAVMIGEEDYLNGEAGLDAFKSSLTSIVDKALAMRGDNGFLVIQTPYAQRDTQRNQQAELYTSAALEVYEGLRDAQKTRVVMVNHFAITNTASFTDKYTNQDGYLNEIGHIEVAKQFIKKIVGNYNGFPVEESYPKLLTKTNTPEVYRAEAPQVTAYNDHLNIALSNDVAVMSDAWNYKLDINGQQITGTMNDTTTINGLKQGSAYTLTITSSDGKQQLAIVTGMVTQGSAAALKPSMQTDLSADQQAIRDLVDGDKPLSWLFIGDSITHGALHTYGFDSIHQTFEKYIRGDLGRRDDVVINTGVSGATTTQQEDNSFNRLDRYSPDVVIIMLGTNDGYQKLPINTYRKNLESIVDKSIAKGAKVVLRTMNPTRDGEIFNDYLNVIREVAKEKGAILVDHYAEWKKEMETRPYLTVNGNWLNDSVHPSPNGQLQTTQSVIRAMGIANEASHMYNFAYEMPAAQERSNLAIQAVNDQQRVAVDWKNLESKYGSAFGSITLNAVCDGITYSVKANKGDDAIITLENLPGGTYEVNIVADLVNTNKTVTFASEQIVVEDPGVEEDTTLVKSILKSAIDKAESASMDKLAPNVKALITLRLAEANAVYANTTATNTQCLEAWLNLANTLHYLDFVADKEALEKLIIECEKINLSDYVSGVEEFEAALKHAKMVLADDSKLQEAIDTAYKQLEQARDGLVKGTPSKALLKRIYVSITNEIGDGSKYKHDTAWDDFQEAYITAQRVIDNGDATTEEIDNAVKALTNTYLEIRLLPDEALLEQLIAFINLIEQTDLTQYAAKDAATILNVKARTEWMIANPDHMKGAEMVQLQDDMRIAIDLLVNGKGDTPDSVKPMNPTAPEKDNVVENPEQTKRQAPVEEVKAPAVKGTTKTGDASNTGAFTSLIILSGAAVAVTQLKRRKK